MEEMHLLQRWQPTANQSAVTCPRMFIGHSSAAHMLETHTEHVHVEASDVQPDTVAAAQTCALYEARISECAAARESPCHVQF